MQEPRSLSTHVWVLGRPFPNPRHRGLQERRFPALDSLLRLLNVKITLCMPATEKCGNVFKYRFCFMEIKYKVSRAKVTDGV